MENIKIPLALVAAMAMQLAGGVWWVSQQAATIASLEETVSQLGSRMAIEDNVNLKRDVQDNADYIDGAFAEIEELWDETDELWTELDSLVVTIGAITKLQQRIAVIENDLKYISRDHNGMLDMKGGMQ
jgi:chromosome segregation ATPase